jgi:hypothetical protein
LCHWFSIVRQRGTIRRAELELFGLPNFVRDAYDPTVPLSWFQAPILVVVLFSFANAFVRERRLATRNALTLCICATAAHFLGYTLVWEYHYTMLLVAVPFLWADWLTEPRAVERLLLLAALRVSLALYLPTPYYQWSHRESRHHLTAIRLLRVAPAVGIYTTGLLLVAVRMVRGLCCSRSEQSNVVRAAPA